jgi:hypothetical protein
MPRTPFDLPSKTCRLGAFIEITEERLGHKDIRALYESENFPAKKAETVN